MIFSPDTAGIALPVILFLALLLDAVVGEFGSLFRVLPHPVALLGGLTGWFDSRLNREKSQRPHTVCPRFGGGRVDDRSGGRDRLGPP